jgi:dynein heavy chain
VRKGVEEMLEAMPEQLNEVEINSRIVDKNPYVVCALQETTRMNGLLVFCQRSLEELNLGLDGALNMSPAMEMVQTGIFKNGVPPSWMAQMSNRVQEVYTLAKWFQDVKNRGEQLVEWTGGKVEEMPKSIWLPGLFNAKAWITAVQQVYARANKLPLDVMKFVTEVTKVTAVDQITEVLTSGAFLHGVTMEGARWNSKTGLVNESLPKELRCLMPIMKVVPLHSDNYPAASKGHYLCPVYANMQRANVYSAQVSIFTLKTKDDQVKWVLASCALLLQDELAAM